MDVKVILISGLPLPFSKIGSWTTMYNYLLEKGEHGFNYIICPKVEDKAKKVSYHFLRNITILDKIKNKLTDSKSRYSNYLEALDQIIEKNKKYIIHIIDNSGIVIPIYTHLNKKYNRNNFYIQYYYQGFSPLFSKKKGQQFLYAIDEIFFLTKLSYKEYLCYYDDCPFKARVVYNATDSHKFKNISINQKENYRKQYNINKQETVFIWCSQDRPKKGLHIILEAFNIIYKKNKKIKLLIIGTCKKINHDGVIVIGRIPNHELPKYYQIADIYLFPSLWKEGFGIVLAEALKCGCYCIASKQGGIPEVLNYGEYGVLIENPNFIEEWVVEMNKAIVVLKTEGKNPYLDKIPKHLYDIGNWIKTINLHLQDAAASLNMFLK